MLIQHGVQEELMFDDFANLPKGKGKEKDIGKRRAYVRVVTTLGGGSLNLELYCEKVRFSCHSGMSRLTSNPGSQNML